MNIPLPPIEFRKLVCGPADDAKFESVGQGLVRMLESENMIAPGSHVLDVGCGCGRVACFLLSTGIASYTGFDRHPGMIDWCKEEITSRDPRFRFDCFDLRSVYVNWDGHPGHLRADEFAFPYPDASFDGAFLASVFTHMPLAEIRHYLQELRRVIRPEGRILLSVFFSGGASRSEDVNFFYKPAEFLNAVYKARLSARLRDADLQVGYNHNWYVLTPAGSVAAPILRQAISGIRKWIKVGGTK